MLKETFFHALDRDGFPVRLGALASGGGERMLFCIHGFGGCAELWRPLLEDLESSMRVVAVDLRGAGRSDKDGRTKLGLRDQAMLLRGVLKETGASGITLCGHGTGAEIAMMLAQDPECAGLIESLVLIAPASGDRKLPPPVRELARRGRAGTFSTEGSARNAAAWMLAAMSFTPSVRERLLPVYAEIYSHCGSRESLYGTAAQLSDRSRRIGEDEIRRISQRVLILCGSGALASGEASARRLAGLLSDCVMEEYGRFSHWCMLEAPAATAARIAEFTGLHAATAIAATEAVIPAAVPPAKKPKRLRFRMAKLFDRWGLDSVLLFGFIKLLQFLKLCGLSAEENGWRKATGIFLKNEKSRFMLGSFFLRYYGGGSVPANLDEAKKVLISGLSEFLRGEECVHWAIEYGIMRIKRRPSANIDVVEALYERGGRLMEIIPHFDGGRAAFPSLSDGDISMLLGNFTAIFNEMSSGGKTCSPRKFGRRLRQVALYANAFNFNVVFELGQMIDRLLNATFIHFEVLPADVDAAEKRRFATPDVKNARHPGGGLLNVECRFESDLSSADLFVQYHHVPVDGLPMQELMQRLKAKWGATRELFYPATGSPAARPEIFYSGDRLFRARIFVDFSLFLKVRKHLNANYRAAMGGEATVAAMLLWGMAHHPFFRDRKMLLPVDMAGEALSGSERELGLVFIRPAEFNVNGSPLRDFLGFQREFNRRCRRTRGGRSESHELLELYSMIHPLFYYFARNFMSGALDEVVGTVGLSIMRDAELFIAPLSDLQSDGFMAIGSMNVPTRDGCRAGAVSICGKRAQIGCYIEAVNALAGNYAEYLGIDAKEIE